MTDKAHLSLMPLMRAQMAAEFELAHRPFITDRNPPNTPRSYLTSCIDADGNTYVRVSYWFNGWGDVGPFVRVLGWQEAPPPIGT